MNEPTEKYVALLRGINVGGKNVIPQAELRNAVAELGLENVKTYIQSGNVLFRGPRRAASAWRALIEEQLSQRFGYPAVAVVFSQRRYRAAVAAAPPDWGRDPARKHHAMFLVAGASPQRILRQLPPLKCDLETATAGPGVLFWSADQQRISRTTLMKVASSPAYQQLTVRNHNTTWKLLELLKSL